MKKVAKAPIKANLILYGAIGLGGYFIFKKMKNFSLSGEISKSTSAFFNGKEIPDFAMSEGENLMQESIEAISKMEISKAELLKIKLDEQIVKMITNVETYDEQTAILLEERDLIDLEAYDEGINDLNNIIDIKNAKQSYDRGWRNTYNTQYLYWKGEYEAGFHLTKELERANAYKALVDERDGWIANRTRQLKNLYAELDVVSTKKLESIQRYNEINDVLASIEQQKAVIIPMITNLRNTLDSIMILLGEST